MKKRKIYILLISFPDTGSKVIRAMKSCYYTHASIGLEEDLNTFYSFVTKGFIVEKLTKYLKPDREPFPCKLYELEVSEKVYESVKKLLAFYVEFKHLWHYAKLGLALSLLKIPYKKNRFGYFCSQFVAEILIASEAAKLKKSSKAYFPEDFGRLPEAKLKCEGDILTVINYFGLLQANFNEK